MLLSNARSLLLLIVKVELLVEELVIDIFKQ